MPAQGNDLNRPLRTQSDLHRFWIQVIRPLGFRATSLWFVPLDGAGRPLDQTIEIGEMPPQPPTSLEPAISMIQQVFDGTPGLSAAFLLTRPGRAALTGADVGYGVRLRDALLRAGLYPWPLHVAGDDDIVVVPPDALTSPRTATS